MSIALLGVGALSLVKLMSTMNCARQTNKPMNEKLDALYIYIYMYIYIYVCMYIYIHIYVDIYIYIYTCVEIE